MSLTEFILHLFVRFLVTLASSLGAQGRDICLAHHFVHSVPYIVGPQPILVEYKFKEKKSEYLGPLGGEEEAPVKLSWVSSWSAFPGTLPVTTPLLLGTLLGSSWAVGQHPPPAAGTFLWRAGAVWTSEAGFSLFAGHHTWPPVQVLSLPLCEAWGSPSSFLGLSLTICKMAGLSETIFEVPSYSFVV